MQHRVHMLKKHQNLFCAIVNSIQYKITLYARQNICIQIASRTNMQLIEDMWTKAL